MSKPDAFVLECETEFKVSPGVVAVEQANGFEIKNFTGWPISVELPPDVSTTGDDSREADLQKILPTVLARRLARKEWLEPGEKKKFHLRKRGVFDYDVTVHTNQGDIAAVGCSPPKIIIEP